MIHPDDDTDDVGVLQDNLRQLRRKVEEQHQELEAARTLVASMREQVEEEAELRQSWIDVFDMQLGDDGAWQFDRSQSEILDRLVALHDDHKALISKWNRFVSEYNAIVAPKPVGAKGRPIAASDEQIERVRQLRRDGRSYSQIVDSTGLSLQTVRTIVAGPVKASEERRKLVRMTLNKEAAARYRARKRERDAMPSRIASLDQKGKDLVSQARRF